MIYYLGLVYYISFTIKPIVDKKKKEKQNNENPTNVLSKPTEVVPYRS